MVKHRSPKPRFQVRVLVGPLALNNSAFVGDVIEKREHLNYCVRGGGVIFFGQWGQPSVKVFLMVRCSYAS